MSLHRESFGRASRVAFLGIILGFSAVCMATATDSMTDKPDTINPKAEQYFTLLSKNPSGDYLYDRFYDAWLDTGTVDGLEKFLKQNASTTNGASGPLFLLSFMRDRAMIKRR